MHFLSHKLEFPPVEQSNKFGILAVGGDLSLERLILAYKKGIFPWYSEGDPIIWYCPDSRMVLFPEKLKVSKSMRQVLKKNIFKVTFNQAFDEVISNCKTIDRDGQSGTWITDEMKTAYIKLHELGIAKSIEVWQNDELVGGLYGVEVGNIFCGESMFSKTSNASKVAFINLVKNAPRNYQLIDCQVYNDHLASLGAEEIPRNEFLKYL
ncbi:leucyl/phenylalanyl-tRNA--protein transferase [Urechidicola croceus]|uniref:Leucyl/phenylalanyl-tRNA--protein transferase n=1 Tax=Urechidicola croceus TaxID=1850246 RepID=A0A1D8PAL9_9FLAO|nr:leucyl/phenylalanyl-tRNA--protein transferase [Urechidicola croceus]AOW21581.1 leucyl/phenylalanyl-tRNA--protein transferase [Urechidicola croceus]